MTPPAPPPARDLGRLGADGLGLIIYYDATNLDLKVAHCGFVIC